MADGREGEERWEDSRTLEGVGGGVDIVTESGRLCWSVYTTNLWISRQQANFAD